jgi:hypothetical protein
MIAKTGFCSHNGGCFPTLSLIYSGLGDAVAEELHLPFDRISLERVFRGLYHFSRAYERGEADGPVNYFAAPENQDLGWSSAAAENLLQRPLPSRITGLDFCGFRLSCERWVKP